jgi:hypothetical protein
VNELAAYFNALCCGNHAAGEFCLVFHNYVHWLDDAVDGDKSYTLEETARVTLEAVVTFSENSFFQEHASSLLPLIVQSVLAWESSEQLANSKTDYRDFIAGQVLKSYYHEVFWHVAVICGGLSHARAVLKEHRKFDYDLRTPERAEQPAQQHDRVPEALRDAEGHEEQGQQKQSCRNDDVAGLSDSGEPVRRAGAEPGACSGRCSGACGSSK